jgi:hypothetical protein
LKIENRFLFPSPLFFLSNPTPQAAQPTFSSSAAQPVSASGPPHPSRLAPRTRHRQPLTCGARMSASTSRHRPVSDSSTSPSPAVARFTATYLGAPPPTPCRAAPLNPSSLAPPPPTTLARQHRRSDSARSLPSHRRSVALVLLSGIAAM